jgi:hypothetical protein
MAGFDRGKARATVGVPDDYDDEAMVAVGHPGDPAELPPHFQAIEVPSGRKTVQEFIRERPFAFSGWRSLPSPSETVQTKILRKIENFIVRRLGRTV